MLTLFASIAPKQKIVYIDEEEQGKKENERETAQQIGDIRRLPLILRRRFRGRITGRYTVEQPREEDEVFHGQGVISGESSR